MIFRNGTFSRTVFFDQRFFCTGVRFLQFVIICFHSY